MRAHLRVRREVFKQYLAGQIACARELAIFFAPNINSYKRFAAGSWAPTTLAWGRDNRTCGFRIVGHGRGACASRRGSPAATSIRISRSPRLIAGGLYGIEHGLELPPALEGNAYVSDAERFPSTLREAIAALESGSMARACARRRRRRSLSELRAHRAGAVRPRRHVLGAGAVCTSVGRAASVGITTYLTRAAWGAWELEAALVPAIYVRAVERAGGAPLLVPPGADAESRDAGGRRRAGVLRRLGPRPGAVRRRGASGDGRHRPRARRLRAGADARRRSQRDVPVLAICRGSQVLNVALGGGIEQHVPDRVGDEVHKRDAGRLRRARRRMSLPGTRLGAIVGDRHDVKSHHHQGFDRLGDGLRESARAQTARSRAWRTRPDASRSASSGIPRQARTRALFEALVAEAAALPRRRKRVATACPFRTRAWRDQSRRQTT